MIGVDARLDVLVAALEEAREASTIEDADKVLITTDGRDVVTMENLTLGVIVIYPLVKIARPAPRTYKLTWTIGIAALANDTARTNAARVIDLLTIVEAAGLFRTPAEATPTSFQLDPSLKTTVPGFALTHEEEHYAS